MLLLLLLTLPTSVVLPNIIANLSEREGERERSLGSSPAEHVFAAGHFRCCSMSQLCALLIESNLFELLHNSVLERPHNLCGN